MSRPSTVKGFGLTFDDLAAFTNHVLYGSPATSRNVPGVKESRRPSHGRTQSAFILPEPMTQERGDRNRHSTSSAGSWRPPSPSSSSRSYAPSRSSSSYEPTSPTSTQFIEHRGRRLTASERAALAHYTVPEMDIADSVGVYDSNNFEPLRLSQ